MKEFVTTYSFVLFSMAAACSGAPDDGSSSRPTAVEPLNSTSVSTEAVAEPAPTIPAPAPTTPCSPEPPGASSYCGPYIDSCGNPSTVGCFGAGQVCLNNTCVTLPKGPGIACIGGCPDLTECDSATGKCVRVSF